MKQPALLALAFAFVVVGCAHRSQPASPQNSRPVITPDLRPLGRIEMVNYQARFVVVSFGAGQMPALGQILNVNHKGLKIGEVRISGPQHQTDTVADIIRGDANVGDEIQAQ